MYSDIRVGVLALQGDFERHLNHLTRLKVDGVEVRRADELRPLDALIIPGGESTTISRLLDKFEMRRDLTEFVKTKPVWGTCAGMIMLARQVDDSRVQPLQAIDISVIRNGYGRQVHSFFADLKLSLNGSQAIVPASFIRAPIVSDVGRGVSVLSEYDGRPILLSQKNCLVSSFHTELHDDPTIVKYFLDKFVMTSNKAL